MDKFRVGIIGCGRPWKTEGSTGFGMSHEHMRGFKASNEVQLVSVADIKPENASKFKEEHGFERTYTDYHQMLKEERLDIVSIATWPHLHAEMVIACAEAGVKAVHCEKPMALTYGDALSMVKTCRERGVQFTIGHQRRFLDPFRKAKNLLTSGAIGKLQRMEAMTSNLYDWGTHWFDQLFFLNDETPVEWVIGQIELRGNHKIFGAPVEGQGLSHFKFRNGVYGLMVTGFEAGWGCQIRLSGTEGVIELGVSGGPDLRVWGKGASAWQTIECSENLHGPEAHRRAILDVIGSLKTGREPELAGRKALQATELIFATWESSRRRGRVDLPLKVEDSALQAMLDATTKN